MYTNLNEGQDVQSFVIPCYRYANQNCSGGVAKEQIEHRQKNANKTAEMPERKICVLGDSRPELRLNVRRDYRRSKKKARYELDVFVTSYELLASNYKIQSNLAKLSFFSAKKTPGTLPIKK